MEFWLRGTTNDPNTIAIEAETRYKAKVFRDIYGIGIWTTTCPILNHTTLKLFLHLKMDKTMAYETVLRQTVIKDMTLDNS